MLKKIIFLIFIIISAGAYFVLQDIYGPETERVDPLTYFDEFRGGQMNMVYEDSRVDWDKPVVENEGMLYVDVEWAEFFIDDRIFYDKAEQILTITNLEETIRVDLDTQLVTVNNQLSDRTIPLHFAHEKWYIGESFLEDEYDFDIAKGVDERLVVASNTSHIKTTAVVTSREAQIRTIPHKQALVLENVVRGDEIIIYNDAENGYVRVRNDDGIIGFMSATHLEVKGATEIKKDKVYEPKAPANPLNDKVRMVWDQLTVRTAGDWNSSKYTSMEGINVISPTWFEFENEEGKLIDRGHPDYVAAAKARGLQVWALMSHNFAEGQFTRPILTSTKKRQYVIDQLVDAVVRYDLDGINIDIENIQPDFSREWVQFMRELYPQMQQVGATLSVDIYMPSAWSGHYERAKVSEVVDYFMVMAYDQHWSGSEEAGPTSGLGWVEEGIILNIEEVPHDKLVLGIPFYTRVWEETVEGLKSRAYGMVASAGTVDRWNVTPVFDEEHKQNYAQYIEGDTVFHVWLEDLGTMAERVRIMETYDLAGYAGWKLGLEDSGIWDVLNQIK